MVTSDANRVLVDHTAMKTLLCQNATVIQTSKYVTTGSGTLVAQASTVEGLSGNTITGSRTLEAQVSTVAGIGVPLNFATGILIAQASTISGVAEALTPYVYMEGGKLYNFMGPDEIYVIVEL